MSVATPTVLPRPQVFPRLLPDPPQPYPVPLPSPGKGSYGNIKARRDLQREMNELSDDEKELEDLNISIRNRGYTYMIPIGRTLTIQEEKNDADEESEGASETGESGNGGPPSGDDADTTQDLDAEMEDMDEEGDVSEDNEMEDADSEEFEEGPSDI